MVEDEEDILELVRYNPAKEGYRVSVVNSGEAALQMAANQKRDLIILDLMRLGVDGLELCRCLKDD